LKILERDDFACQYCGDTEKTLHVHHKIYFTNYNPWDYEDNILMTLCDDCHRDVHTGMDEALTDLCESVKSAGFLPKDVLELANGFRIMPLVHLPEVIASVISRTCSDSDLQNMAMDNFFAILKQKSNGKAIH